MLGNTALLVYFFVILIISMGLPHAFAVLPIVVDSKYTVEEYITGLNAPTVMAFVDDSILILEKNTGNVKLVKDGRLVEEPILHVDVDPLGEKGMLGIAVVDEVVYLYFTEKAGDASFNRIYKYGWDGKSLDNPVLVRELPVHDDPLKSEHNGGIMVVKEGIVYAVIGDTGKRGILQNFEEGDFYDTSVILMVNHDELVLRSSESDNPLDHYYAMGIRNSYGLAIDPVTGFMWDTENGLIDFDEINLVEPRFNSGWGSIQGPTTKAYIKDFPQFVDFRYSDPEFSWKITVAPTGLTFVDSDLFWDYTDKLLVGDVVTGTIWQFRLNAERTGFEFDDPNLHDLVLNAGDNPNEIVFATGFGMITDIKFGPDGFLYVVSLSDGSIYRIMPEYHDAQAGTHWIESFFSIFYAFLNGLVDKPDCTLEPQPRSDFAGCNLAGRDFSSSDLTLSNFNDADLEQANFINADLRLASFENTAMANSNLEGADLAMANFNNAKLDDSVFKKAHMKYVNLSNTSLTNTDFSGAIVTKSSLNNTSARSADFSSAHMSYSFFTNADLSFANFSNAKLTLSVGKNAVLHSADLSGATLTFARWSGVNMSGTDLHMASMKGIRLQSANLSNADLSGAYLRSAYLNNADLSGANLQGANLVWARMNNADLSGANLQGANLTNANFNNAQMDKCTGCPE